MDIRKDTVSNYRLPQQVYGALSLQYSGPSAVDESEAPTISFTISRDGDLTEEVSVETALVDIGTTAEQDYIDLIERITFAPGEDSKNFAVQVLDDQDFEEEEEFLVALRYPSGATVSTAPISIRILSDEQLATFKANTFEILQEVGIHCPSERALKIYAEHGAEVDFETQIVKLSPDVVLVRVFASGTIDGEYTTKQLDLIDYFFQNPDLGFGDDEGHIASGDSGGPAFLYDAGEGRWEIAGIASYGIRLGFFFGE